MNGIEEMNLVISLASNILYHVEAIKEENDPEVIDVLLDAIQELDTEGARVLEVKAKDIRTCIREGDGNFKEIQEKCVRLNLV